MAEKGIQTTSADKLPELAQLVMENERLRRKHRKVQHRRDHYARLYYRCQADLDEKKWELHHARAKISELKEQLAALSLPYATKQDLSAPTSTRSDIGLHSSLRAHSHHHITPSHHHSNHSHHLHPQKQQYNGDSSKLAIPGSIPPRPNTIPHRSESDSTSPDSGTSFSPGLGMGAPGIDPLLRSHPASSFPHSHEVASKTAKSKSLPRSMRLHDEEETAHSSTTIRHMRGYRNGDKEAKMALQRQGRGGERERKPEGDDWVAWVEQRSHLPQFEEDGSSHLRHPREGWQEDEEVEEEKRENVAVVESVEVGLVSDDSGATPRSPVHFKNTTPPSSVASPRARHPVFEQRVPPDLSFSLSQGASLPHTPLSPPLPHAQKGPKKMPTHPHVHFSLSQEAYVSSPLYIRKPAFKEPLVGPSQMHKRSRTVSEGRRSCQSPLPHAPTSPHDADPQNYSDSENEPVMAQSLPQSAFRKPLHTLPVYRQLSHPARLVPPVHYKMPNSSRDPATEPTHPQSQSHNPPPQQSPPPLPTSLRLPSSSHRFHPHPPPSSQPPTLPPPHIHTHSHSTSKTSHHASVRSPPSLTSPEMALATFSNRNNMTSNVSLTQDPAEPAEEDEETEDEALEGEESCYEQLSPDELYNVVLKISDPKCSIAKLEIAESDLGDAAAMQGLCKGLRQNTSLRELSLPSNNIGAESLEVLLQHIQHCVNIRELKLRGNDIGKACAPLIKALMEHTSLNSLILTGNEIERHGDLLHRALPSDFTMEYDTAEGSVDSGVVVADGDHFNNSCNSSLKYLNV